MKPKQNNICSEYHNWAVLVFVDFKLRVWI